MNVSINRLLTFIVLSFIWSCANPTEQRESKVLTSKVKSDQNKDQDTLIVINEPLVEEVTKDKRGRQLNENDQVTEGSIIFDRKLLQGIWAFDSTSNADFFIKEDLVYFVMNPEKGYSYELKSDDLFFYFDGITTSDKVLKLTADSLITKNSEGVITKYYNRDVK